MHDDKASNSLRIAEKIWRVPYNTFVENRLHNASAYVYDNIKKSNWPFLVQKNHIVSSKSKLQLVSIKSDRQTWKLIDCLSI